MIMVTTFYEASSMKMSLPTSIIIDWPFLASVVLVRKAVI